MTETDTLPAAIVVSIDDRNLEYTRVRVRCPFCAEVHTHGMPDDDGDDGERVPHCGYPHSRPDGPYRITFDGDPVRESTLAPVCGVLQCDNPVTRHFDICVVCNACDELVTGIRDAVLTFLNDRLPVPRKGRWAGSSEDDSGDGEGVYDRESSVRQEIMTADRSWRGPTAGDRGWQEGVHHVRASA